MISVFDIGNENYTGNGDAVLQPTKCSHKQVAAGQYNLTITHPLDPQEKWKHIVPDAIIRAPVPEETITTAFSGLEADVYKTNTEAALREGPSEPTAINYTAWAIGTLYESGDKVTYKNKNYKCTTEHYATAAATPESRPGWWEEIARYTSGSPALVQLKTGTDLLFAEDAGSGWYKMSTFYGLEGYMKSSQLTYDRHLTPAETQPRTITTQLFRVKTVSVDTKGNTLTATAEHVSYDLSGVLVEDAKIAKRSPAFALAWIEQNFMVDYRGTIATNLTDEDDGTYTGEIKGKNAIFALLDPDKGIVGTFDAMYRRDNWDVFVMRKEDRDPVFRIRYGKNMLGVSWNIKTDGLVNRVVPVAKAADGSDFYLDPVKWVDSPLISSQPVIRMEMIKVPGQVGKDDGTETETKWTETTLRAEMQKKAEERFSVDKADQVVHEVTVDFEMMGDTDEYRQLKGLEKVLMYDKVLAINENIGLSITAEVTEIEYDCIRKKITSIKISNVQNSEERSVSGFNVFNNSITPEKLTDDVRGEIVEEASDRPGVVDVSDSDPTLSWGTRSKVGSVQGTDIHVTLPENPAPGVIDNLTSQSATDALSANQGRVLNGKMTPSYSRIKDNNNNDLGWIYRIGRLRIITLQNKNATIPAAGITLSDADIAYDDFRSVGKYYDGTSNSSCLIKINYNKKILYIANYENTNISGTYVTGTLVYVSRD